MSTLRTNHRPVLVVTDSDSIENSRQLAETVCSGLQRAGLTALACPVLDQTSRSKKLFVGVKDFDSLLDRASCVVLHEHSLDTESLESGAIGAVATRARQHGVPCHAVVDQDKLDSFCRRMLDLQHVLTSDNKLEERSHELGLKLVEDFKPLAT